MTSAVDAGPRPGRRPASEGWAPTVAAGVLGAAPPALLSALGSVAPGLVPAHSAADVRLLLPAAPGGGPAAPYYATSAERAFAWGHDVPDAGETPEDVLSRRECPGLVIRPGLVRLHAGAVGLHDVYYRAVEGAVVFATSIDPLVDVHPASLEVDWQAWGCLLSMLHPVGRATTFRQVRRLQGAEAIEMDRRTRRWWVSTRRPASWHVHPHPGIGPREVAGTLRAAVRRRAPDRVDLTLSGGWDSRALLLALDRSRTDVHAWTTWPDDGVESDVPLARAVAGGAGVAHDVVRTDDRPWPDDAAWVRRRLEFQTPWHPWLARLAQRLSRRDRVLLDGVGGDQVVRGRLVSFPAVARAAPGSPQAQAVLHALTVGPPTPDMLGTGGLEWMRAARAEAWHDVVSELVEAPAGPTLAVLRSRTSRGTGPSPVRLFGPAGPLLLPFLDADVLATALAAAGHPAGPAEFYRAMLTDLDPLLGPLPSTNDPPPRGERPKPMRQLSREALSAMSTLLTELVAIDGLLGDTLRSRLAADPLGTTTELLASPRGRVWVGGLCCLADWLRVYGDRLAGVRPPWSTSA